MAATSEQLSKAAEAAAKSGIFSKLGEAPTSSIGKGIQWLSYHGTTGGVRNLANSVGITKEFSHAANVSRGGTFVRAMLAPVMAPINLVAHGLGGGVRVAKLGASKYASAFKAHPIWTSIGTAAVAAPVAYHMIAGEKKPQSHAREQMDEVNNQQQQISDVQQMLTQSQPAPMIEQQPLSTTADQPVQSDVPPVVDVPEKFASMQQATPQIAANTAMDMGRVDEAQLARA